MQLLHMWFADTSLDLFDVTPHLMEGLPCLFFLFLN